MCLWPVTKSLTLPLSRSQRPRLGFPAPAVTARARCPRDALSARILGPRENTPCSLLREKLLREPGWPWHSPGLGLSPPELSERDGSALSPAAAAASSTARRHREGSGGDSTAIPRLWGPAECGM